LKNIVVLFCFYTSKRYIYEKLTAMKLELNQNEVVIKAQDSNFIKEENEKVKGKLVITNQRVFFKSIATNISKPDFEILFDQIADIVFFNTMKIIPNGLQILTNDNRDMRFHLKKRNAWVEQLHKMC